MSVLHLLRLCRTSAVLRSLMSSRTKIFCLFTVDNSGVFDADDDHGNVAGRLSNGTPPSGQDSSSRPDGHGLWPSSAWDLHTGESVGPRACGVTGTGSTAQAGHMIRCCVQYRLMHRLLFRSLKMSSGFMLLNTLQRRQGYLACSTYHANKHKEHHL